MVQLAEATISESTEKWLSKWQKIINDIPASETNTAFEEQVKQVDTEWATHNTARNKKFQEIRKTLRGLCSGNLGCPYCETSVGKTIDHFKPKALYPGLIFSWSNFIPACSDCKTVKKDQFKIRRHDNGEFEELKKGSVPQPGDDLLINPRYENPADLLELDLSTGEFLERYDKETFEYDRANYTILMLELNKRGELSRARKNAYTTFRLYLQEYADKKDAGASQAELDQQRDALLSLNYQAVWEEMKRQIHLYPESYPQLNALFKRVEEALSWHWHNRPALDISPQILESLEASSV